MCIGIHRFQGDERDVMLFSPVISRGAARETAGFLRSNGNLFNVAITRARGVLYVVWRLVCAQPVRGGVGTVQVPRGNLRPSLQSRLQRHRGKLEGRQVGPRSLNESL